MLLRKFGLRMAYNVVIGIPAKRGIQTVANYIAQVLSMPQAASKLLAAVDTVVDELEAFPAFRSVDFVISKRIGKEVRHAVVGNYCMYYYIDNSAKTVTIFSFVHQRQDATAHVANDYLLI